MKIIQKICLVALLAFSIASTHATHFRFGHITWKRIGGTTSRTVEISVTEAWRTSFLGTGEISYSFGDGGFFNTSGATTIATLSDLAGESYTIVRRTVTRTYTSDGPFTIRGNSCCRISSLVNAGDASEQLTAIVDLRAGNQGSPVASIPIILQMSIGMNSVVLPIADPDLDPWTVRLATSAESFIPNIATIGANSVSVTPGGVLNWNTTGGVVGRKYAVQLVVQENHPGGASGVVPLDFIIELVPTTANLPPTTVCPAITSYVIPSGDTLNLSFTGTDPEGRPLRVNHLGLPPGATFTPAAGSTGPSPLTANFSWTPTIADRGSAHSVTVVFTDDAGQQTTCAFSVAVPANTPPTVDCGADVMLLAPGAHTQDIVIEDVDGDGLDYSIAVNGIVVQSGSFPPGLVAPVTIPFTHTYGAGTHTVEVSVEDFFFTSSCEFSVAVPSLLTTSCAVRPLASGLILTLGATDPTDPTPMIFIADSASAFVAGPFESGDQVIVRTNPTRAPFSASQPGYAGRIQIQGQPLVYAENALGVVTAPLAVPH